MLAVAEFLPDIALPSIPAGALVPLRPPIGRTTVLVSIHGIDCDGCRRYLDGLTRSAEEFNVWEARLLIVVPAAQELHQAFAAVLVDEAHRISPPGSAAVLVADRYGHIYDASYAGEGHALPSPRQLEEWLKFLGTLCPE